jgi:hypothetical protein
MNLDDAQRTKVAEWIAQGLKLSDIQNRLNELGVNITYMEVRLLVDDLRLTPKDVEAPKTPAPAMPPAAPPPNQPPASGATPGATPATGGVAISVDQLAKPGAVVSGTVTFTDGHTADWQIDQLGRLGVVPREQGYKPPPADVPQFQAALERELARMGF